MTVFLHKGNYINPLSFRCHSAWCICSDKRVALHIKREKIARQGYIKYFRKLRTILAILCYPSLVTWLLWYFSSVRCIAINLWWNSISLSYSRIPSISQCAFFARFVSFFMFFAYFSLFHELFKNILASVDLQIMKI